MADYVKSKPAAIGFKNIQLLKHDVLGIGSYGKVCKAKCDELLCAAKIIHETLVGPTAEDLVPSKREHRLPIRRFLQECEFLSSIRHPNIVQYLGTYQDPQNGLPVLLMELLDGSLTHYLETSLTLIPYHIQVNICYDIALALAFLHSNSIVHGDLSGNNILMIGNLRAKLTDFGMASLIDQTSRRTLTMCPGTEAYMPPEAVDDHPVFGEKMDCFALGVIALQILTRQFPMPGDRHKEVHIKRYMFLTETMKVCVPEIERRQNHITQVDSKHPLRPILLHCLKDKDAKRPSAQQLCGSLSALRKSSCYNQSKKERGSSQQKDNLREQKEQQPAISHSTEKKEGATMLHQENLHSAKDEKEMELQRVKEQLRQSKDLIVQYQGEIEELKQMKTHQGSQDTKHGATPDVKVNRQEVLPQIIPNTKEIDAERARHLDELQERLDVLQEIGILFKENLDGEAMPSSKQKFKRLLHRLKEEDKDRRLDEMEHTLDSMQVFAEPKRESSKWREIGKLPFLIQRKDSEVAANGSSNIYIAHGRSTGLHAYNTSSKECHKLLDCPQANYSLAVVDGLLSILGVAVATPASSSVLRE